VQAVTQEPHVLVRWLGGERPHERDVIEPGAGDVTVVRGPRPIAEDGANALRAGALLGVVDGRERRAHRLAVLALQAIGEHDGVFVLLLERHDGPHDERVALALVPGDDVLDPRVPPARAEHVRVIDDAVEVGVEIGAVRPAGEAEALLHGLEHHGVLLGARIVRPVLRAIDEREWEVALAHVEDRRHARGEVDDVERIVAGVVVDGGAVRDVLEVELAREPDGDRGERAPALERGEAFPGDALEARR